MARTHRRALRRNDRFVGLTAALLIVCGAAPAFAQCGEDWPGCNSTFDYCFGFNCSDGYAPPFPGYLPDNGPITPRRQPAPPPNEPPPDKFAKFVPRTPVAAQQVDLAVRATRASFVPRLGPQPQGRNLSVPISVPIVKGTEPVAANGDFVVEETDIRLPGFGVDYTFTRYYGSSIDYQSVIGYPSTPPALLRGFHRPGGRGTMIQVDWA